MCDIIVDARHLVPCMVSDHDCGFSCFKYDDGYTECDGVTNSFGRCFRAI